MTGPENKDVENLKRQIRDVIMEVNTIKVKIGLRFPCN